MVGVIYVYFDTVFGFYVVFVCLLVCLFLTAYMFQHNCSDTCCFECLVCMFCIFVFTPVQCN